MADPNGCAHLPSIPVPVRFVERQINWKVPGTQRAERFRMFSASHLATSDYEKHPIVSSMKITFMSHVMKGPFLMVQSPFFDCFGAFRCGLCCLKSTSLWAMSKRCGISLDVHYPHQKNEIFSDFLRDIVYIPTILSILYIYI